MKTIILSLAHGNNVAGKQSPDGSYKEYQGCRRLGYYIADILEKKGVNVKLIPERGIDIEPGLSERVRLENLIPSPAFVLSLHNNAAGSDGKWKTARGIEIYTTPGQTASDSYATLIFTSLQRALPKLNGSFPFTIFWRKDMSDGDPDKEAWFTELMSKHPSALLELGFQDNKEDLKWLTDDKLLTTIGAILADVLFEIANT